MIIRHYCMIDLTLSLQQQDELGTTVTFLLQMREQVQGC